jgi:hypothetical protein
MRSRTILENTELQVRVVVCLGTGHLSVSTYRKISDESIRAVM